jgi:ATP-dependent DNA helicase RecG
MTLVSRINTRLTEDVIRFEPEGKFLERKGRDTKPSKIADELIGMLNAGGGVLIYGIANDGTLEDLQQGELLRNSSGSLDAYRKLVHDLIGSSAKFVGELRLR